MRKQERQDLQEIRETLRETRQDFNDLRKTLDLSALPQSERTRVETIITMASSGVLLATIDLGDVLSGRGKQQD